MNKGIETAGGIILGAISAYLVSAILYTAQGYQLSNFNYGLIHRVSTYYLYAQLGLAANIGIFFLLMRRDKLHYFSRGYMFITLAIALWIFYVEIG